MKKRLIYSLGIIDAAPLAAFSAGLPEPVLAHRIHQSDEFRFSDAEFGLAADLHRRARQTGLDSFYTGETEWTPDDFALDRIYQLYLPMVEGDFVSGKDEVISSQRCPQCGHVQQMLRSDARIQLSLDAAALPPVFTTAWGRATCIEAGFLHDLCRAGLTGGALDLPVRIAGSSTAEYRLLTSTVDLGMAAGDQYTRRCAACDRPQDGGGYFVMFRHPHTRGDVFYSRAIGQTAPIVTGRVAAAISRKLGCPDDAPQFFLGWFPEDQELARLPDLDRVRPSSHDTESP